MSGAENVMANSLRDAVSSDNVFIPADDDRIIYIGRFKQTFDDDDSAWKKQFAWPASQIAVNFRGPSVEAYLMGSKSKDRFLAVVDDDVVADFVTDKQSWGTFTLAKDLNSSTTHSLVLWKATEDISMHSDKGAAQFGGFNLPEGGEFFGNFERMTRKLEFIGDSDTAGWCADGSSTSGDKATNTQNSYETWAAQLTRALDAEMSGCLAISGIGVLSWPIQQYLNYTLPFDNSEEWDYTTYTPDAVVLLIGPNDPSTRPLFEDKFIAAYMDLMELVATKYSYAEVKPKIIHVCGGSINGFDPCPNIQVANDAFNDGRTDGFEGYYTTMDETDWDTINAKNSGYQGCDSHYNSAGHSVLEGDILDQVKEVMEWS